MSAAGYQELAATKDEVEAAVDRSVAAAELLCASLRDDVESRLSRWQRSRSGAGRSRARTRAGTAYRA